MSSEIKELFSGNPTAFTITLANIASSTSYAGQQSDVVDNTTTRYGRLLVPFFLTQGSTPTGSRAAYVFGIRSDKNTTAMRDDDAGASAAAWTRLNAPFLTRPDGTRAILANKASPSTGDKLKGVFDFFYPGREFAIGWSHDTAVNTNSTGSNHTAGYTGVNPEAQ
jgi:hypothetical protein